MINRLLAAIALVVLAGPALAQTTTGNEFQTGTVGKTTVGTVMMCLNSSGVAVPASSGTCANALQVSGTIGSAVTGAGASATAQRVAPSTDANFGVSPYPWSTTAGTTAAPITASSGNVANASGVATLAAVAGKTTYITGFQISSGGATAGTCVTAAVTGTISGTMSYSYCAATGATVPGTPLIVSFNPPVRASAVNTAIAVTLPALGAGNTNATVSAQGYQL